MEQLPFAQGVEAPPVYPPIPVLSPVLGPVLAQCTIVSLMKSMPQHCLASQSVRLDEKEWQWLLWSCY